MSGEEIHELLNELDTNHNGQVEVEEYLQVRQLCALHCVCALCVCVVWGYGVYLWCVFIVCVYCVCVHCVCTVCVNCMCALCVCYVFVHCVRAWCVCSLTSGQVLLILTCKVECLISTSVTDSYPQL